jgi:uncharacterized sodium:solute symporter family permease YidK
MELTTLDWVIVAAYFALALGIGLWASRDAGKSAKSFFLAGRNMPWWLLGISMVATTFSTDTPNLVTGLVRETRRKWKLGVVGVFTHRDAHRICLCQIVASIGRFDGY